MNRCYLGELSNLGVDVATVQKIHFTFAMDCQVLEDDFVVLSAYDSLSSVGVSLVGCSHNADVNLLFADNRSWLVVANVAVKAA